MRFEVGRQGRGERSGPILFLPVLVTLILALSFSGSCNRNSREESRPEGRSHKEALPPDEVPAASGPDVFLILIDALRADALGVYGAAGDPSPHLDRLAREGVVFTRAYTASPFTMTSAASLFTGLYPWRHGVVFEGGAGLALAPDIPVMAEAFRAGGYRTAAFSGTYFRLSRNGFARGFDTFDEACAEEFFENSAECLNRRVLAWLAEREPGRPAFVYLHYVDPHRPYYPPEPYRTRFTAGLARPEHDDTARGEIDQFGENRKWWQFYRKPSAADLAWLRGLYQGEVSYADSQVGELLAALDRARGGGPAPVVMVIADHGEAFSEHGVLEHVSELHDPVMRIPMILWGTAARGKTVDDVARTVDVMPTLLGLAGIKPPSGISGRSLVPLLQGEHLLPAPAPAVHFLDHQPEYALVLWPWKLFHQPESNTSVLHRLDRDPGETADVGAEFPTQLENMRALLDNLLKLGPPGGAAAETFDPETLERMKALGYIQEEHRP